MSLHRIFAVSLGIALLAALGTDARAQGKGQVVTSMDTTVLFEFDSAELDAEAMRQLDEIAEWMKENPERTLVVAGHADRTGTKEYNAQLGEERATQTKQYLMDKGIEAERIVTVSFGEQLPASDRAAENRRTVFYTSRPRTGSGGEQGSGAAQPPPGEQQGGMHDDGSGDVMGESSDVIQPGSEDDRSTWETVIGQEESEYGKPAEHLMTPHGLGISVGGGVIGFVGDDAREFTSTGGAWEARFVYGTRLRIAGEAAYYGSAQGIEALGLDDSSVLLGSGLEANARVNVLKVNRFQPYVFGGVGWTRYDLVNESFNTSNVRENASHLHIPFGLGVGFRMAGLLVDVRGTMRSALGDELIEGGRLDLADDVSIEQPDLTTWGVAARVGWEF